MIERNPRSIGQKRKGSWHENECKRTKDNGNIKVELITKDSHSNCWKTDEASGYFDIYYTGKKMGKSIIKSHKEHQ